MFENFVILGAGLGTRLGKLTENQCKPMVKHNGRPLIDYTIDSLPEGRDIYVTYHYKPDDMLLYLKDRVKGFINTRGNGNAYFLNDSLFRSFFEPIVVVPCDIQFKINWQKLFEEFLYNDCQNTIVTIPESWGNGDYVTFDKEYTIKNISRNNKAPYKASGIQILVPSSILSFDNDFYQIWDTLIKFKNLKVSTIQPEYWRAIDEEKDILL